MNDIQFSNAEKAVLVDKLKHYFATELDIELKQFPAEFLLDFLSSTFGAHYYNRGLLDAQAVLETRLESIEEAIGALEKPVDTTR